jgi:hypothetical protein
MGNDRTQRDAEGRNWILGIAEPPGLDFGGSRYHLFQPTLPLVNMTIIKELQPG